MSDRNNQDDASLRYAAIGILICKFIGGAFCGMVLTFIGCAHAHGRHGTRAMQDWWNENVLIFLLVATLAGGFLVPLGVTLYRRHREAQKTPFVSRVKKRKQKQEDAFPDDF